MLLCVENILYVEIKWDSYGFGQNLRSNTFIRNCNIFVDSVTQFSAFRYPCNVICLPSQISGTVEDSFTMLYCKQMSCLYFHPVKLQLCYALLKDLSMMYRALWDRRHKGATRISQHWRIRVSPECLRSHNAGYIMLNPIMTWLIWFWYIMKPKFAREVPKGEVANHAL